MNGGQETFEIECECGRMHELTISMNVWDVEIEAMKEWSETYQ